MSTRETTSGLAPVVAAAIDPRAQDEQFPTDRRFRALIENSLDGIALVNPDGKLLYVSPSTSRILGYEQQEFLKHDLFGFVHPDDHDMARRALTEIAANPGQTTRGEYRARHKDGSWHWIEVVAQNLLAESSVQAVVANFRDITERKLSEVALRARECEQAALAQLGQHALAGGTLDALMDETVASVAATLQVEFCKILELLPDGSALLLRAGIGWKPGMVGQATVSSGRESQAGFTLLSNEPVVVEDFDAETRFIAPPLLVEHGVRSGLSVIIQTKHRPFGILGAHSNRRRSFTKDQVNFLQSVANLVGLVIERQLAADELARYSLRFQNLSRRLIVVQEAERRRLARELHDDIGQVLTVLRFLLETNTPAGTGVPATKLKEATKQLSDLIERVRDQSLALRPAMLDHLGLLPALLWLIDQFTRQAGVRVVFKHNGLENRFVADVETAAYRIVQESLTNVIRHAGVGDVTVRAWADAGSLGIQIEDRGKGFDAESVLAAGKTSGLAGMQERVTLLEGRLTIDSRVGEGTQITVELPLTDLAST